ARPRRQGRGGRAAPAGLPPDRGPGPGGNRSGVRGPARVRARDRGAARRGHQAGGPGGPGAPAARGRPGHDRGGTRARARVRPRVGGAAAMSVVVCAGDEFISADLLARALADAGVEGEFRRIDTAWPTEPFRSVDGVREAAGDPARLAELVRGADALVTHLAPLTAEVLGAGSPTLRVVGVTRGGPVNVDLPAATAA